MKQFNSKIIFQGAIILGSTMLVAHAQDRKGADKTVIIKRQDSLIQVPKDVTIRRIPEHDVLIERFERPIVKMFKGDTLLAANDDSTINRMRRRLELDRRRLRPDDISIRMPNALNGFNDDFFIRPPRPFMVERPNSQSFQYNFTDKDGISNRMIIQIDDVEANEMLKVTGLKEPKQTLQVADLVLFPNYSIGKMTLSFSIPTKGNVAVKILDSDFLPVFSHQESIANMYVQQFGMLKNGIYFIHIKQGEASYVKKILKE